MHTVSFIGTGNVAYRLSLAFKQRGILVKYIHGRNHEEGAKLAGILNKFEYNLLGEKNITQYSNNITDLFSSDIILLTVSDAAIHEVENNLIAAYRSLNQSQEKGEEKKLIVAHTSGANPITMDNIHNLTFAVFYPLMTLSKIKPVEMKLVPFLLETHDKSTEEVLISLVNQLGSEYKICNSDERLKTHASAVFISNFVNYLTGLACKAGAPNQMFLMPLALETVRKAFLYEDPEKVQTGPAVRGDVSTIEKHLNVLKDMPEQREVYEFLTDKILKKYNKTK